MPLNILIIPSEHFLTYQSPLGAIFQWHQAKALHNAGYDVAVLSSSAISPRFLLRGYPYTAFERKAGIDIFRNYTPTLLPMRFKPLKDQIRTQTRNALRFFERSFAKRAMPDIIHAHNVFFAGFIAAKIKEKFKIPFVLTEHSTAYARGGIDAQIDPLIKEECLLHADHLSAVSLPFSSLLNARFALENETRRFHVLPNLLEDIFEAAPPRRDQKKKPFTFLTLGSLEPKKNHSLLLRAFSRSFSTRDALLRIGGDGPLREQLQKEAQDLGISEKTAFIGLLNREEVQKEMVAADCFVLPSTYETFGVVLMEALACGLPLVATRSGGPEDIVNDENGILVPTNDVDALGNALLRIYEKSDSYSRTALREQCLSRFGEKAFLSRIEAIYQNAINC